MIGLFQPRFNWSSCLKANGVDDPDACMAWAFGEEWGTMRLANSCDAWNKLHSDIFIMFGSDEIIKSFSKIAKAYLERKQ